MNIRARVTPPATGIPGEPEIDPVICAQERARRKAGVDYARASVRLEGLVVPAYAEELYASYIDGKLTIKELGEKILSGSHR